MSEIEAGSQSKQLLSWQPSEKSADVIINPGKSLADARSVDSVLNSGIMAGVQKVFCDNIVGQNYRLNARPDWRAIGATEAWANEYKTILESKFRLMSNSIEGFLDADGARTFTDLVRLTLCTFVQTGEILCTTERDGSAWRPIETCIRVINPQRLSNKDMEPDSPTLRRGIVLSSSGRHIAYQIRNGLSGDYGINYDVYKWKTVRRNSPTGRRLVLHVYESVMAEQSRGIAAMTAALKNLRMIDRFNELTLEAQAIGASIVAVATSDYPTEMLASAFGGIPNGSSETRDAYLDLSKQMTTVYNAMLKSANITVNGAKIVCLPAGVKIDAKRLGEPIIDPSKFMASQYRSAARALGISYEHFTGDYSGTNYVTVRASNGESWGHLKIIKTMTTDVVANYVLRLIVEEMLINGELPMPSGRTIIDFYRDPIFREGLCSANWMGGSPTSLDAVKEIQSATMRMAALVSSPSIEAAKMGYDWDTEILPSIIEDMGKLEQKNINYFDAISNKGQQNSEDKQNEDEANSLGNKRTEAGSEG